MRGRDRIALAAAAVAILGACTQPQPPAPRRGDAARTRLSGPHTFRLAVVGDFGSGDATEQAVATMLRDHTRRYPVDALVTTGDNIYPDGQPSGFFQRWTKPYRWVANDDVSVIAALGNHDVRTNDGTDVMSLLSMPARWYRRAIGDAELIVLDSTRIGDPAQTAWLDRQLERPAPAWRIVVFHHPPFGCGPHGDSTTLIESWVPRLEAGGVDLVLNGHEHSYQRFAPRNGVTYVITGGGGASLYRIRGCSDRAPELRVGRSVHHALVVAGNATELRLRAFGLRGGFDELVLR